MYFMRNVYFYLSAVLGRLISARTLDQMLPFTQMVEQFQWREGGAREIEIERNMTKSTRITENPKILGKSNNSFILSFRFLLSVANCYRNYSITNICEAKFWWWNTFCVFVQREFLSQILFSENNFELNRFSMKHKGIEHQMATSRLISEFLFSYF